MPQITIIYLEYCIGENFEASCHTSTVVVITNAVFGSMKSSRCISNAHGCQQVYNINYLYAY